MPINNINTLQNFEDLKYTKEIANQENGVLNTDYYIHALANLEQRNEYRYSNGIKYGILRYDKTVTVGSRDVADLTTNSEIAGTTALFELSNELSFEIYVNNIESYLKHSQIYNDGTVMKMLLFGKILGTADTVETNNVEIQYNEINLSDHTLNEAYRVFYLDDNTNNNIYILLHLKKTQTLANGYNYKLTVYKLSFSQDSTVRSLFRASTYESENISSVFDNAELDVTKTDLFTELKKNCVYSTETIENNYTLDCSIDTIDEQFIKINESSMLYDNYDKINELLYFNYYNISQYIRAINNDVTITYPNILKYYSGKQFNSNVDTLKIMIARALYSKIYNDLDSNIERSGAQLVIPSGTTITYVSNVENALQLYYTDDIYVYFINNAPNNIAANSSNTGIKFIYGGIDKTIIYNLYSKYNTKYTEFIDSFVVYRKYVLPYIDESHLWNINDNQTTIYASGESAGNPNIFIVRTNYDTSHNPVIYGQQLNRNDIQQNMLSYKATSVYITYNNGGTEKVEKHMYIFAVPIINSKTIDKLKYATLFITSNVTLNSDNTYSTDAPMVTTIWTIDDNENGDPCFVCISADGKPDGPPMTFDDLFGLDSAIYRKFTEYGHICNVFDDLISLKLPRTILNGSEPKKSNYFVIERNTYIDNLIPEQWDESAYNYNIVEMKINNTLNMPEFSYARSSKYTDVKKLLNIWDENGESTKQIYYTGSILQRAEQEIVGRDTNATTNDMMDAADELLSQSVASPTDTSTQHSTHVTVVGSFDQDVISRYGDEYEFDNTTLEQLPEYLPISYVPILKESNLLHQDNNIINRTNIYSFTKNDGIYYSYLGTSCADKNKNILHIGTAEFSYMINLGKESLVDSSTSASEGIFRQTNKLSVDLSYTEIHSEETFIHNLNVKNSIRTNKYNNPTNNTITTITTIELYHIINLYDNDNVLVEMLFKEDGSTNNNYAHEYTDTAPTKVFTSMLIHNDTTNKQLEKYLREYYPELFNNTYINNVNSIKIADRENYSSDSPILNMTGTYIKRDNIVLFDHPLIIHIITTGNETNIYV